MKPQVSVFVHTNTLGPNRVELVLEAVEGDGRWFKLYDGALFLSMDAQSLGLLEPIPDAPSSGPQFRLKRRGTVQAEQLAQMHFVGP